MDDNKKFIGIGDDQGKSGSGIRGTRNSFDLARNGRKRKKPSNESEINSKSDNR